MADEYYGNAQFQTMLQQRNHDDKFVSESILVGNILDLGLADFIEADILSGNTATIRKHHKRTDRDGTYTPTITNGTLYPEADANHGQIVDHTFFGMIPIKDDYSTRHGAVGYHGLLKDDPRRIATEISLDSLNMDSMEVASNILEPPPPGSIGSAEFEPYAKAWRKDPALQAEFPTLEAYHQSIYNDHREQEEGMSDVTDVFIGLCASGSTLSEVNVVGMYHTMAHIYPKITFNGLNYKKVKDYPAQSYMFEYTCQHFVAVCGWHGWSHVIRQGTVKNKFDEGEPKWYKAKSNYRFVKGKDAQLSITDGDPIVEILQTNVIEESGWSINSKIKNIGAGMLEIQVQLPARNGVRIYGEIRIWDYGTLHSVTADDGHVVALLASMGGTAGNSGDLADVEAEQSFSVADGSTTIGAIDGEYTNYSHTLENWGDSAGFLVSDAGVITSHSPLDYSTAKVYWIKVKVDNFTAGGTDEKYITIQINVQNTNNETEPPEREPPGDIDDEEEFGPNLLFFPIEYKAAREVPLFKRERFLRESTTMILYTVNEVNLKWYEKTWFKVVLFIVFVILSVLFPGTGFAGLSALTADAVVTAAVTLAFTSILINGLLSAIDNPYIAFIVQVAAMLIAGNISGKFNLSNITLADAAIIGMEASGTAIKKYWAQQIKEMKEEYEDFAETLGKYEQKIDDYIEDNNLQMRSDSSDWILFSSQTAVTESTSNTMDRTTNVDNAIIVDIDEQVDVGQMLNLYK